MQTFCFSLSETALNATPLTRTHRISLQQTSLCPLAGYLSAMCATNDSHLLPNAGISKGCMAERDGEEERGYYLRREQCYDGCCDLVNSHHSDFTLSVKQNGVKQRQNNVTGNDIREQREDRRHRS